MNEEFVCDLSVCQDCMLLHANGEISPDRPADLPEPLSLIGFGQWVALGGDELGFSTTSCEACGDILHGDRYAMALFQATRRSLADEARRILSVVHTVPSVAGRVLAIERAAQYRRAMRAYYPAT